MQVPLSVGTEQLTLSIAIMQEPTYVAIIQVLRFYYNFIGGTFCCTSAVNLFLAVTKVTVSVTITQLKVSTTLMQVKVSAENMFK